MVDISAADLVYVITRSQSQGVAPKKVVDVTLEIDPPGNGRTYPALGIPLDKALLGCPNMVESLIVVDSTNSDNAPAAGANGLMYKFDLINLTLRLFAINVDGDGFTVPSELATHQGLDAQFVKLRVYGW